MPYGIDVSHHQSATAVPWGSVRETSEFCICRASYGSGLRDREVVRHMKAARAHGFCVGLYQFFRPSQSVQGHFEMFKSVAAEVGCEPGDMVPWLDIEKDPVPKPGTEVSPAWSEPARELCEMLEAEFGGCGIYITQREWGMLGKPDWVLQRPLWVAHYTNRVPATPAGKDPHIHQHRVGPYDINGPGGYFGDEKGLILDQNRALLPLPLIAGAIPAGPGKPEAAWIGAPELGLPDDLRGELDDIKQEDIAEK